MPQPDLGQESGLPGGERVAGGRRSTYPQRLEQAALDHRLLGAEPAVWQAPARFSLVSKRREDPDFFDVQKHSIVMGPGQVM